MRMIRAVVVMSAVAATLLGSGAAPATATTATYTFRFLTFANDFDGSGPPNSTFTISVFNGTTLIDSTSATTSAGGNYHTFFAGSGEMKPGWKLKVTQGAQLLRTLRIPSVSANVDRVTDMVSGVAPAGHILVVRALDCTMAEDCTLKATRHLTVGASGHYSTDVTSTFDIRGNDEVIARYLTPQGDLVSAQTTASAFGIDPTVNQVFGCALAGEDVSLKLRATPGGSQLENHTVVQGAADTCFDQVFSMAFTLGRQVTANFASDAKITVPDTAASHSGTVATVHCLPNRRILLEWFHDVMHHVTGTADAAGVFVHDLANEDPLVVPSGQELRLQCETPKGDRLEFRRTLA